MNMDGLLQNGTFAIAGVTFFVSGFMPGPANFAKPKTLAKPPKY